MFGLAFLTPALLRIIAIGCAIAALVIGFEWVQHTAEKRGYDKAQTEYMQKALVAEEAARKRERELQTKLEVAENEAKKREADLTLAADNARAESDGLRSDLASLGDRLSRASADSLRRYAATANLVLQECTDRYTELARKADGHASDSLMLQQAWPSENRK